MPVFSVVGSICVNHVQLLHTPDHFIAEVESFSSVLVWRCNFVVMLEMLAACVRDEADTSCHGKCTAFNEYTSSTVNSCVERVLPVLRSIDVCR